MKSTTLKDKGLLKSIIDAIPMTLDTNSVQYISQGKYEFIILNKTKNEVKDILSSLPNFIDYCRIFSEQGKVYVRVKYN